MRWVLLLGRLLFGGLFILAAARGAAEASAVAAALEAQSVPFPRATVFISVLLFALGGLSVLLGFATRVGLGVILLGLIVTTPVMHAFWMLSDPARRAPEIAMFMQNIALVGATLSMMAMPVAWPFSIDEWLARPHYFRGDLLGRIKARLQAGLRHLPARSAPSDSADAHSLLPMRRNVSPASAWYVSGWWTASVDDTVLIENERLTIIGSAGEWSAPHSAYWKEAREWTPSQRQAFHGRRTECLPGSGASPCAFCW